MCLIKYIRQLFIVALIVFSTSVYAGSADIEGSISYQINNSNTRANIKIDRIKNNNASGRTGTLYVTLWLTVNSNPVSSGFSAARIRLADSLSSSNGTLSGGESFVNIDFDTDFDRPPNGEYFVHYFTSQAPDLLTILDSRTFTRKLTFANPNPNPNPNPNSGDDHSNSNENASQFNLNGIIDGVLNSASDIDFFRIDINESGEMQITSEGTRVDIRGTLYNSSGETITINDDLDQDRCIASGGLESGECNFSINTNLNSGTYFLSVEPSIPSSFANAIGTPNYRIRNSFIANTSQPPSPTEDSGGGAFNTTLFGILLILGFIRRFRINICGA